MKKIGIILTAIMLLAACEKQKVDPPQHEPSTPMSLTETSWVGSYSYTYQGYPATVTWNLDFNTDSAGELFLEQTVAATPQPSVSLAFGYTFDGSSGTIACEEFADTLGFEYDSALRTIAMELYVGDGRNIYGGVIRFYPRGQQPSEPFPANSTWTAQQQVEANDTLVLPVKWDIDFWEYAMGGSLTCRVNNSGPSSHIFWQYDSLAHSGALRVNGRQYPFTYDPISEVLTLEYSTTIPVNSVVLPIGGTIMFCKKEAE